MGEFEYTKSKNKGYVIVERMSNNIYIQGKYRLLHIQICAVLDIESIVGITLYLQDIKFTLTLDIFDMCTPELQQKLIPVREQMKQEEDRQTEATNQVKHPSHINLSQQKVSHFLSLSGKLAFFYNIQKKSEISYF